MCLNFLVDMSRLWNIYEGPKGTVSTLSDGLSSVPCWTGEARLRMNYATLRNTSWHVVIVVPTK